MNIIRQILIVFGICLFATVVSGLLPFTLPASVLAILLLVGLLGFGLVKEGSVAGLCDFLQGHLTFLFLPAGVGLLEHLDLLASSGLALAAVCMVSGFFTFAAATLTVRLVQRIQKGGRREGTDL